MEKDRSLYLRTCDKNFQSYNKFQWPNQVGAEVSAPDWKPNKECGNGLHGLLNGNGGSSLLSDDESAIWMVVSANQSESIDLVGKHKFPRCRIEHIGNRDSAVKYLVDAGCQGVHFARIIAGNDCTLTGGYNCTLTGGNRSTLTGGDYCKLTGGNGCTLTGGYGCTLTGGDGCKLTGGYGCKLTGGDGCTLTGGGGSVLQGGLGSELRICYWDDKAKRNRTVIGYVGEDLEANVAYKLDEAHKFVKV